MKKLSLPISNVLAVMILLSCVTKTAPSEAAMLCSQILLSQKEIKARAFDFKKEYDRVEIRYGAKLQIQAVPSKTSLKYLYLIEPSTGERVAELNYRHLKDERKMIVVWSEAQKANIGLEEILLAVALKKHPEVKIISTNSLVERNEARIRKSLTDGLSVEEAIKETPTFKMRAEFGYDQIIPESINAHFGFDVRKRQDNHGKYVEIQDAVGPLGLAELSRQMDWSLPEMFEQTQVALESVLAKYARHQFPWQKKSSQEQLSEAIESAASKEPQVDDLMVVGSNRLRHEADRVSPGIWTVNLGSEGHWHFRAGTGHGAVNPRAAWIVELVRDAMDFKLVPEARYGSLNGVAGIFTRSIEGGTLADYQGHINIETVQQMLAFDFLVQHKDTHFKNFKVTQQAELKGLDYESVFDISPLLLRQVESPFGNVLPTVYDIGFISKLEALTPEVARTRWDKKMIPEEIDAFLLLREIILEDARSKSL